MVILEGNCEVMEILKLKTKADVIIFPILKKQLNLMPFTFSHDTKSTVKLKITITTKFKSNRSSTGYIKEAGRWKTPTFPCDFFTKSLHYLLLIQVLLIV